MDIRLQSHGGYVRFVVRDEAMEQIYYYGFLN